VDGLRGIDRAAADPSVLSQLRLAPLLAGVPGVPLRGNTLAGSTSGSATLGGLRHPLSAGRAAQVEDIRGRACREDRKSFPLRRGIWLLSDYRSTLWVSIISLNNTRANSTRGIHDDQSNHPQTDPLPVRSDAPWRHGRFCLGPGDRSRAPRQQRRWRWRMPLHRWAIQVGIGADTAPARAPGRRRERYRANPLPR
jgi:hypothetical protein